MTEPVLIVGYGRAGLRHAKLLDSLSLRYETVDPLVPADYVNLEEALDAKKYCRVVICTPPDLHLDQIAYCLDYGLSVLCEKPLCELGQLNSINIGGLVGYERVMVAYNYRYNETLLRARGKFMADTNQRPSAGWGVFSEQYRKSAIPSWGLLLDHVSHDIDILSWMSGGIKHVSMAAHVRGINQEWWEVHGFTEGNRPFKIEERVWDHPMERDVHMITPVGLVSIAATESMYMNMWKAFLGGNYYPGLKEAVETQKWLEEIARIGGEDAKG